MKTCIGHTRQRRDLGKNVFPKREVGSKGTGNYRMIHVLLASRAREETKRDTRADPSAKGRETRQGAADDGGMRKN